MRKFTLWSREKLLRAAAQNAGMFCVRRYKDGQPRRYIIQCMEKGWMRPDGTGHSWRWYRLTDAGWDEVERLQRIQP